MASSFRRSHAFTQLPVRPGRSSLALPTVVRGARVPLGPRGTYVTFGHSGFAYRAKLEDTPPPRADGQIVTAWVHALALTSPDTLLSDLETRSQRANLFKVYLWSAGVLLLLSLIASGYLFIALLVIAGVAAFFVHRWDLDRRTARIVYDVDDPEIVGRLALCSLAAEALARSARLWHVFSSMRTADAKYHAGAGTLIQRTATRCDLSSLYGVELNIDCWSVPVGPQQLLFLPDRLVVRQGTQHASIPYEWLTSVHATTKFIEDGHVPPDAQVVDTTWRFVNKSGGPDLRFNNNRQLPVALYGELTLQSSNGLQIVIQSSNPLATHNAAFALQELARVARIPSAPRQAPTPMPAVPRSEPWQHAAAQPPATSPYVAPRPNQIAPPAWHPAPAPGRPPPPLPQLVPVLRPQQPREQTLPPSTEARFLGPSARVVVAGRVLQGPLTYLADHEGRDTDASTIVTALPVGDAKYAGPLPYWPTYSGADPHQRARYLEWMAGGRTDAAIEVSYPFIFFYGLERRALIDHVDEELARAEVVRLNAIYGGSNSFRRYAFDFLAFLLARQVASPSLREDELQEKVEPLLGQSDNALAVMAGWYAMHGRALPAKYALHVVRTMEAAKRGVVTTRSAVELADLFQLRYRAELGEGLLLQAAKRPLTVEYRAASATLLHLRRPITAQIPDVLKRVGQLRKLVTIWNSCVDDLRKASGRKAGAQRLDASAWAALPADLRAEYDHPDQDKWDATVAASSLLAGFHIVRASQLAGLTGLARVDRLTAAQMRRLAERAAEVGYAVEPEPRVRAKPGRWDDELLIWRTASVGVPDARVYGPVFTMLSLAMTVAMADGVFTQEEQDVVNSFLSEMFSLDSDMRVRVEALKHLMARDPSRVGAVAKTLKETRSRDQLEKVVRVLVAIAAADGIIAETEEKALRTLYRSLGLPPGDLVSAIAKTGARLERDVVVEAAPAVVGVAGTPIPARSGTVTAFRLDQAAIDAIVADTKDVAAILAEVFEQGDEEPLSDRSPPGSDGATPNRRVEAAAVVPAWAATLDVRYFGALEELLRKEAWTAEEVRALAGRHRLMPAAIVDTINSWSDEALGDFIIEDVGEWKVNRDLVKAHA